MKLAFMTYYIGMHSGVRELLEQCDITSFTHWAEVTGRLSCGEPREGTDVWPGYNTTRVRASRRLLYDNPDLPETTLPCRRKSAIVKVVHFIRSTILVEQQKTLRSPTG